MHDAYLHGPIVLKLGRHLGIIDAEMPAKFRHNWLMLNIDNMQRTLKHDLKLGALIMPRIPLKWGKGDAIHEFVIEIAILNITSLDIRYVDLQI